MEFAVFVLESWPAKESFQVLENQAGKLFIIFYIIMSDPIADMLTQIRNALAVGKKEIVLPSSKLKLAIAKIFEAERWLEKAEILPRDEGDSYDCLKLVFRYKHNGRPVINDLKRISKPGLKKYSGKNELKRVLNGFGIAVVSTSQGLMTNKEARKRGVGGEVLCEIY